MPLDFMRRDEDPGLLSRRLLALSVEEAPPRRRLDWERAANRAISFAAGVALGALAALWLIWGAS